MPVVRHSRPLREIGRSFAACQGHSFTSGDASPLMFPPAMGCCRAPTSLRYWCPDLAGTDNDAADADTRDVLIVGILLGASGGALVGAIQEFAHAESDEDRKSRRH